MLGWGTTSTRLAGLGRVRYTGAKSTLASAVVPMDKGLLLRFESPLDAQKASRPSQLHRHELALRAHLQVRLAAAQGDDTPGVDPLVPSSAYLSKDGRSVFVGLPGIKPVMQMRVGWTLATADGTAFQDSASFTPYELTTFNPESGGFREADR